MFITFTTLNEFVPTCVLLFRISFLVTLLGSILSDVTMISNDSNSLAASYQTIQDNVAAGKVAITVGGIQFMARSSTTVRLIALIVTISELYSEC